MEQIALDKLTATKITIGLMGYLLENFEAPIVVVGYGEKDGSGGFGLCSDTIASENDFTVRTIPAAVSWEGFQKAVCDQGATLGIRIGGVETGSGWYRVCGPDGTEFTRQIEAVVEAEPESVGYCPTWVQGEWFLPRPEMLSA